MIGTGWVALVAATGTVTALALGNRLSGRTRNHLCIAALILALIGVVQQGQQVIGGLDDILQGRSVDLENFLLAVLTLMPQFAFGAFVGLLILVGRPGKKSMRWGLALLCALLTELSIAVWDRRPPLLAELENKLIPVPFLALVPAEASVYWEDDPVPVWLGMQRHSYFSTVQATAVALSRSRAFEYQRRAASLEPLGVRDSYFQLGFGPSLWPEMHPIAPISIRIACREPQLDFMVLSEVTEDAIARWTNPATGMEFGLYNCHRLNTAIRVR
jgi:hypothetical protein